MDSDWKHLTLLDVTSTPTLIPVKDESSTLTTTTPGSRARESSVGTDRMSPPILVRDRLKNDGASTNAIRLPDRTFDDLCPSLPHRVTSAGSTFCILLSAANFREVGLELARRYDWGRRYYWELIDSTIGIKRMENILLMSSVFPLTNEVNNSCFMCLIT